MRREIRPWESAGAGSGQQAQGGRRGCLLASTQVFASAQLLFAFLPEVPLQELPGVSIKPHFILLLLPKLKPCSSRMARWTLRAFWQRGPDVLCDLLVLHPAQASQFSFVFLLSSSAFPLICSSIHPPSYLLPIHPASLYPSPFLSPTHPLPSPMHTHLVFPSESSSSVVTSKHTIVRQCAGRPVPVLTWFKSREWPVQLGTIWKAVFEEGTF